VVGRDPNNPSDQDEFILTAIRPLLLDVMWAQEQDTVASDWSQSKRDFDMVVCHLSIDHCTILPILGNPVVVEDQVGLGVALMTLPALLQPGKIALTVQFDTI
jgi:hypothetical protein